MKVTTQKINGNEARKKYGHIYQDMVNRIRSGYYSGKLPGINQLAKEYSVNPLTITKALDMLTKASMIEKRPRVGTFVKHKRCIAVLELDKMHSGSHSLSGSTVYDKIIRGIHETMDSHNVSVLFQSCSPTEKEFIESLKRDVDGFILITQQDIFDNDLTLFNDIPWVKAMGDIAATQSPAHVTYNNKIIGIQAAEYLLAQKCENFIFLGNRAKGIFQERFCEFNDRLESFGYSPETIFASYDMGVNELAELIRESIKRLYTGPETGIFIAADRYAMVLHQVLYSLGIFPGRDIKVISCDNNDYHLHGLFPRPPVLDIRMDSIGRGAAEMLIKLISQKKLSEFEKVIFTPELIVNKESSAVKTAVYAN